MTTPLENLNNKPDPSKMNLNAVLGARFPPFGALPFPMMSFLPQALLSRGINHPLGSTQETIEKKIKPDPKAPEAQNLPNDLQKNLMMNHMLGSSPPLPLIQDRNHLLMARLLIDNELRRQEVSKL